MKIGRSCCREHPAPASDLGSLLDKQNLQEAANEKLQKSRTPSGFQEPEGIGAPSLAEFGPTPVHSERFRQRLRRSIIDPADMTGAARQEGRYGYRSDHKKMASDAMRT